MHNKLILLGILGIASLGAAQETGYNTNWSGHRTFHVNTFNNSQTSTSISANVQKYPMLVRLGQADSAIFTAAKADGADIRFTKANNTARLQHSIETWDAVNRIGALWVLLDTVYSNSLTQNFRMHWGNAGAADSSKPTAVFDSANGFEAVWHMGNATGAAGRQNSVAGGNAAVPGGDSITLADQFVPRAGLIGMADTLSSHTSNNLNAQHFTLGSGYQFAQSAGTISMWVKYLAAGNWINFISLSAGTSIGGGLNAGGRTNNIWFGRNGNTSNFRFGTSTVFNDTIQGVEATNRDISGGLNPVDTWAHFTVTFQDTGHSRKLYKNGALAGDFPAAGTPADSINNILPVTRAQTFLGRSQWTNNGDRNFRGVMDEVRISKVARSADWILLDYASQNPAQILVVDSTAPAIAYGVDSIVTEVGFAVQTVLPTIFTGVPHPTVAISPALPAGLTFTTGNTNRGMISGTPTASQTTTMHVITATNGKGTSRDTIYVTVAASTENYATWSNIKTLTFNAPVTGTVTRFPFLLRLTAADSAVFAQAGANGASLRFSRTDAIKLKYSIDSWDAVNRKAAIWILVDQVFAGSNTLRMHWGNGAAASLSSGPSVFEKENGYLAVWHMGNPVGDTLGGARPNMVNPGTNDATPYYAAAPVASMIQDGVIGKADSLRGQGSSANGDHFHLGAGAAFASNFSTGVTLSLWIKPTVYPGNSFAQWFTLGNRTTAAACPPCAGTGDGRHSIWIGRVGNANNFVGGEALNNSTTGGRIDGPTGSALLDEWQYYAMTINGTAANGHTLYRNGVQIAQRTNTATLQAVERTANFLGRATWNDPTSTGVFDEARVSSVPRSADWIALEYASQAPGVSPLSTLSYPALSGAPGAPITPAASNLSGAVSYSLSGTLPAGIVFNDTTGTFSGTPTGPGASTVAVTATSGVWSATANVSLSFGAADGAYSTAWSGHKYVSVNTPNGVAGTLQKFPLLVRLGTADAAIFAASQGNGGDIRFTKLNNTTRLQHEIEHWDSTGRSAAVWVLVDTVIGNTSGSRLRMHYGNAAVADSSKPSAVFDSANGYLGVWHMGNVSSNTAPRPNAVAGGFPATPSASTANLASGFAPRAGVIAMADSIRGQNSGSNTTAKNNDDHFNLGNSGYLFTGGQVTISMWMKLNDPIGSTNYHHFITFGNGTNAADNIWMGRIGNTNTFGQRSATANGESQAMEVEEGLSPLGAWANFTITRSGASGTTAQTYKNGASIFGPEATDGTINAVSRTMNYIGRSNWGDPNVRMMMDEVRVQKVARSAAWVRFEFENQKAAGSTFTALTDALVNVVTGIRDPSAMLAGSALSFQQLGQGLLFRIHSDAAAKARLSVVDMHGRTVWNRTVATASGMNQVTWNGESKSGSSLGAGIYVVRMSLLDADGTVTHRLDKKIPMAR